MRERKITKTTQKAAKIIFTILLITKNSFCLAVYDGGGIGTSTVPINPNASAIEPQGSNDLFETTWHEICPTLGLNPASLIPILSIIGNSDEAYGTLNIELMQNSVVEITDYLNIITQNREAIAIDIEKLEIFNNPRFLKLEDGFAETAKEAEIVRNILYNIDNALERSENELNNKLVLLTSAISSLEDIAYIEGDFASDLSIMPDQLLHENMNKLASFLNELSANVFPMLSLNEKEDFQGKILNLVSTLKSLNDNRLAGYIQKLTDLGNSLSVMEETVYDKLINSDDKIRDAGYSLLDLKINEWDNLNFEEKKLKLISLTSIYDDLINSGVISQEITNYVTQLDTAKNKLYDYRVFDDFLHYFGFECSWLSNMQFALSRKQREIDVLNRLGSITGEAIAKADELLSRVTIEINSDITSTGHELRLLLNEMQILQSYITADNLKEFKDWKTETNIDERLQQLKSLIEALPADYSRQINQRAFWDAQTALNTLNSTIRSYERMITPPENPVIAPSLPNSVVVTIAGASPTPATQTSSQDTQQPQVTTAGNATPSDNTATATVSQIQTPAQATESQTGNQSQNPLGPLALDAAGLGATILGATILETATTAGFDNTENRPAITIDPNLNTPGLDATNLRSEERSSIPSTETAPDTVDQSQGVLYTLEEFKTFQNQAPAWLDSNDPYSEERQALVFNVINNAIAVTQYSNVDPDYGRRMVAKFEPLLAEYTKKLDLLLTDASFVKAEYSQIVSEENIKIDEKIDLSSIDAKAIGFIGINQLNEGHIVISAETKENSNLNNIRGSIQELSITQTSNMLDPKDENIEIDSKELPKELIESIKNAWEDGTITKNKSGAYVLIQVTIGEGINKKTVYIIKEADTIVYINSTKPGVVIKEILRRILINRPNASELAVNRMFLLIIIIGLICVGFGIGLAIYITKLQLQKTNYFPSTIRAGKSFQHNLAPSWKQR